MAGPILRAQLSNQLIPGLNKVFGLSYGQIAGQYQQIFESATSNRSFELEQLMTGFESAPVKGEGASVQYFVAQEAWTARYTFEVVAMAFAITEEAIEDNLYDSFSKLRASAMGRSMADRKERKGADVFNNGFSTSYPGGDGVPLFSASHPTISGTTQSNTSTAQFSEAALEDATTRINLRKDDREILIGANPRAILIPPALQFEAKRILHSELRVGVANNDINALRYGGYYSDGVIMNHRLTDTNNWFIRTDVPNGTKMFVRRKLKSGMEPDFNTGNMRYKVSERYGFGWTEWRQWEGFNVS